MDDYHCLTLVGQPGEPETDFKARLTAFWTHLIRTRPDDYARVHAEATAFASSGERPTRQYLAEAGVVGALTAELTAAGVDFEPVDEDEVYSKYEASSPDWFQIEH
ncbi:MAG TPA: hypothetical protein VFG68_00910 [Fimbriiglobus sp.]|nr:hypothetical protein [Fimbriiglobus sp.]